MTESADHERVILSRRNPGGVKRGKGSRAIETQTILRGGSFAALRRSAASPAQDDTRSSA
jgi:hypothetical protein